MAELMNILEFPLEKFHKVNRDKFDELKKHIAKEISASLYGSVSALMGVSPAIGILKTDISKHTEYYDDYEETGFEKKN